MNPKQAVLAFALVTPLVFLNPWVSAGEEHQHDQDTEYRQQGAHVHGIAALNLAMEGNDLQIEIDSPAMNIVGFEHVPSSAEDRATLAKAITTLKDGERLFKFSDNANCRLDQAIVVTALLDAEHGERGGHAQEQAETHGHEQTRGHQDAAHESEHQDEAHEREHEAETHSDILAVYRFQCEAPDKLKTLGIELFDAFPGMEQIQVQYVVESTQGSAKLTASEQTIEF